MTIDKRWLVAVLIPGLLLFGACSKEAGAVMGEAGDAADVDEVVEIATTDKLRFVPATVEVEAGQTVEFQITNEATGEHEFVLGPLHEHGAGMEHTDPSSTGRLEPGAAGSVIWTFPEDGTVEFACYVAGHNEQGMTGTITVSG